MQLFVRILTYVFFAGVFGSVIVIVLTFVEDFRDIFSSEPAPARQQSVQVMEEHVAAD